MSAVANRSNTKTMSPDEFIERLPPGMADSCGTVIAHFRVPKKTLEEQPLTEVERANLMAALTLEHNSEEEALEYIYKCEEDLKKQGPAILGAVCPPENVECRTFEFDNIKVFFHLDVPSYYPQGTYTFYIGRPGCKPSQCIDWYSENIRVTALGFGQMWGECRVLKLPGGARIRVHYSTDNGDRRTKSFVFPILTARERDLYVPQQVRRDEDGEIIDLDSEVLYL